MKTIFSRKFNRRNPQYLLTSKQIDLIKIIIREQVEREQAKYFNDRLKKIRPGPWAYRDIFTIIGNKNRSYSKDISMNGVRIAGFSDKLQVFRDHFSAAFGHSATNGNTESISKAISDAISQTENPILFSGDCTSLNSRGRLGLIDLKYLLDVSK